MNMKILKQVSQSRVFSHWEDVEKVRITQRSDIVFPLAAYNDLAWNLCKIESSDLNNIYIISSDDWKTDGICIPDYKLITAINNYNQSNKKNGKISDIKAKENIFLSDPNGLDTKIILVTDNHKGPYTIIEGNKRSIALGSLKRLIGLQTYIGVSPAIRNYIWSRYAY